MTFHRFAYGALLVVSAAVGILIGKWINFPFITVDPKINLVQAASLLNTLGIAIVISIILDKKKSKDNAKKEIMTKRIDSVVETIEALQDEVSIGRVGLHPALSFSKRLTKSVSYIWGALNDNGFSIDVKQETITDSIRKVHKGLTTTPIRNPAAKSGTTGSAPQTSVSDDYIMLGPTTVSSLMNEIESLKNELFRAQLAIQAN